MIATEFWGVKERKTGRTLWTAETCRLCRKVVGPALFRFLGAQRNCTVLVSCVKFSTNKSVARQNRKAVTRGGSLPTPKRSEKSTRL